MESRLRGYAGASLAPLAGFLPLLLVGLLTGPAWVGTTVDRVYSIRRHGPYRRSRRRAKGERRR